MMAFPKQNTDEKEQDSPAQPDLAQRDPAAQRQTLAQLRSRQEQLPELSVALRDSQTSPFRRALLKFSSQWFLIPQGCGITAVVLYSLEYQFRGLKHISYVIWALTFVCLVAVIILYFVRAAIHPIWTLQAIRRDLPEAAGLSCISITFTSVIQMAALVFGDRWSTATSVLWWVNLGIALPVSIILPYMFMREQAPGIDKYSPIVLLPLVAATTLAAGGGVVVSSTAASQDSAMPIVTLSLLFLGLAMPLALLFDAAYAVRLLDKNPPASDKVAQDMILCGPWAQGSFAMQSLGRYIATAAPALPILTGIGVPAQQASFVLGCGSIFMGFVCWGQALFWWVFAVSSILRSWISHRAKSSGSAYGPQYAISAWSLVFPWGVFSHATSEVGRQWNSPAFRVWSAVLAIALVGILLANLVLTVHGIIVGDLVFEARDNRRCLEGEAGKNSSLSSL